MAVLEARPARSLPHRLDIHTLRRTPVDLTLYAVSATGRVSLGDVLKNVKYVQVEKAGDGVVMLTPVNIKAASGQSLAADDEDQPQG